MQLYFTSLFFFYVYSAYIYIPIVIVETPITIILLDGKSIDLANASVLGCVPSHTVSLYLVWLAAINKIEGTSD